MPTTIFKNIRVFDGEKIHQSATVVVKDGKISSVSKSAPSTIEDGATTIDGAGHTLLPGLIEAHMHAHLSPGQGIIRCFTPVEGSRLLGHVEALLIHSTGPEILKPAIACGITTCLDMHNTPDDVIRLKKECAASAQLPDLKSAFYGATIEGGWPKPIVLHLDPSPEVSQQIENALQDRNRY
jgi:alpha-D-ribose 1-methylphosphonate 5-triphosphate diphosphatase PhnM